jgi:hypothetical protein
MTKVLVIGPPRSGTTWVGQALGRSYDTRYVHEPDGDHEPYALKAKVGRSGQIVLRPGDVAARYEKLWTGAFAGGGRSRSARERLARRGFGTTRVIHRSAALRGETVPYKLRLALALAAPLRPAPTANVVVKSVHACLAAEWIDAVFAPRILVVERHPLNVLSSWKQHSHGAIPWMLAPLAAYAQREWDLELPVETESRFARQVMSLGVLLGALHEATARNPEWLVRRHEDLCVDPAAGFRALTAELGLDYSEETERYLEESNQPGEGYVTKRLTSTLPSKWQRELTADELQEAADVFDLFPSSLGLSAAMREREQPR